MTANEIRNSFLEFFKTKKHKIVPSAPVIPHGDPTLLFTNAGMNQFKDVFLGQGSRGFTRATDTQKCIRVSGKHNDLEEVGADTYHHTFFEMLGNWSFGDYYKKEAIAWAWELLTEVWKLDPERLHATVFRTDDEAFELWKEFLPESRIQRFDEKDNFWEMGETGPCGPCSEIHYDKTPDLSGAPLVNAGRPEVIEIWNLVFIQYNRHADGTLEELSAKHVDTGMGFERICAVIQGADSNYDTDVFTPLIKKIAEMSGRGYKTDLDDPDSVAMRVIADHARALSFAIADGALPGNEGRGYVLRRILRRGSRYARNLGLKEPAIYELASVLAETMGESFPELVEQKDIIQKVIKGEEESFLATLERGIEKFESLASQGSEKVVSGKDAFLLYDTFGFPIDLTELMAREKGMKVDVAGFTAEMKKQKERSRKARKSTGAEVETPVVDAKSEFVGYDSLECEGKVVFAEDNLIVLDKTPFYAESGGQVSDTGRIVLAGETYEVLDVKKSGEAIVHVCDRDPEPLVGSTALAKVDDGARSRTIRNHSATHLAHEALRRVLGTHVRQSGSLVAPDYMRFDFNHFEKVSKEELKRIENLVNKKIFERIPVATEVLSIDEARENPNIKMFFGDKYGDTVRAVTMGSDYSIELCGGTHVKNTAEIGMFKIVSESSIAAGVRRIEAITGPAVEKYVSDLESKIEGLKGDLESRESEIRKLEKELESEKIKDLGAEVDNWIKDAKIIDNVKIVAEKIDVDDPDTMRELADKLRDKLGTGVGLLATVADGKVRLVCAVTDDLKKKAPAGKLVGNIAKRLGGGGGGKPHLATAGGKNPEELDAALADFSETVREFLN